MVIRARRAVRRHDFARLYGAVKPGDALPQFRRAQNRAIGQTARAEIGKERCPVLAREREQLVKGHRIHTGFGDVVPRAILIFVHPLFHGKRPDVHTLFSFAYMKCFSRPFGTPETQTAARRPPLSRS